MEWIDLNTERPPIAKWVLCLSTKGGHWLGWRANGAWYVNTNYGQLCLENNDPKRKLEIAYWCPIPDLPKELTDKLFPNETD